MFNFFKKKASKPMAVSIHPSVDGGVQARFVSFTGGTLSASARTRR